MHMQLELNTLSISKTDPSLHAFEKYDVQASINEVDNMEEQSIFKYSFTILSNPKNVRILSEGNVHVHGSIKERQELLEKDQSEIPQILTMIYKELFPTFFLISKSSNVPCPPYDMGILGIKESEFKPETLEEETESEKEVREDISTENTDEGEKTAAKDDSEDADESIGDKPVEEPLLNEQSKSNLS